MQENLFVSATLLTSISSSSTGSTSSSPSSSLEDDLASSSWASVTFGKAETTSFLLPLDLGDSGVDFGLLELSEGGFLAALRGSTNFCQKK